jgi:hypothetical protein
MRRLMPSKAFKSISHTASNNPLQPLVVPDGGELNAELLNAFGYALSCTTISWTHL